MKLHRFYIPRVPTPATFEIVDPRIVHQIRTVLRLKVGEQFVVWSGTEHDSVVRVGAYKKGCVVVRRIRRETNGREPSRSIHLYCAVLKKENFDVVVQKATELGVTQITPLLTARTVKQHLRSERLRAIAIEAAEQSGRARIPVIEDVCSFSSALAHSDGAETRLLFDPRGDDLKETLSLVQSSPRLSIFIGPEGGWSEEEVAFARSCGAVPTSLGPLWLRSETAAIVAAFLGVFLTA